MKPNFSFNFQTFGFKIESGQKIILMLMSKMFNAH